MHQIRGAAPERQLINVWQLVKVQLRPSSLHQARVAVLLLELVWDKLDLRARNWFDLRDDTAKIMIALRRFDRRLVESMICLRHVTGVFGDVSSHEI